MFWGEKKASESHSGCVQLRHPKRQLISVPHLGDVSNRGHSFFVTFKKGGKALLSTCRTNPGRQSDNVRKRERPYFQKLRIQGQSGYSASIFMERVKSGSFSFTEEDSSLGSSEGHFDVPH